MKEQPRKEGSDHLLKSTLEATQGQIPSQSPTDATSGRWHFDENLLKKPSVCPWVFSRVVYMQHHDCMQHHGYTVMRERHTRGHEPSARKARRISFSSWCAGPPWRGEGHFRFQIFVRTVYLA